VVENCNKANRLAEVYPVPTKQDREECYSSSDLRSSTDTVRKFPVASSELLQRIVQLSLYMFQRTNRVILISTLGSSITNTDSIILRANPLVHY
jgi:hypothetical protein